MRRIGNRIERLERERLEPDCHLCRLVVPSDEELEGVPRPGQHPAASREREALLAVWRERARNQQAKPQRVRCPKCGRLRAESTWDEMGRLFGVATEEEFERLSLLMNLDRGLDPLHEWYHYAGQPKPAGLIVDGTPVPHTEEHELHTAWLNRRSSSGPAILARVAELQRERMRAFEESLAPA